MGATVVTVKIEVQGRRTRHAKAAARELSSALARVPEVSSVQDDFDFEVPHIAVHYIFHVPKKPIAAAIIATAAQHPKATITVSQGLGWAVTITGEASGEQRELLSAVLGEDTD